MVFNFFKRGSKDGERPAGSRPETVVRPPQRRSERAAAGSAGGYPSTGAGAPERERARSLAMETAAKIDAIESEMARDFLKPHNGSAKAAASGPALDESSVIVAETRPPAPSAAPAPAPEPVPVVAEEPTQVEDDLTTDVLAENAHAIVVSTESSSVLEETVVLFANRQDELAEAGLREALHTNTQALGDERAWRLLLELLLQRNEKAGFDQVCEAFVARFGVAAPAWFSYAARTPAPAVVSEVRSGLPSVSLPASINSAIVPQLEQFKALAAQFSALELDVGAARSIDLIGAELLLRVLNAFKRASHELTLRGAEPLLVAVRSAIQPGRRDPSDAAWMLTLELQRLLGRQHDFEETGIEYCITYEVSPPSWEPPPANIHAGRSAEPPPIELPPVQPASGLVNLEWKGDFQGSDADQQIQRLLGSGGAGQHVVVDCARLRRMAFAAASTLLAATIRLAQTGATVEFREVNPLVSGLLQVLGITGLAQVHPRRG